MVYFNKEEKDHVHLTKREVEKVKENNDQEELNQLRIYISNCPKCKRLVNDVFEDIILENAKKGAKEHKHITKEEILNSLSKENKERYNCLLDKINKEKCSYCKLLFLKVSMDKSLDI